MWASFIDIFHLFPHSWAADVEEASLVIIWNLTIEMRSSFQDSPLVTFCTLGHHDELTPLLSGRRMDQRRHPLDKENFFSCTFFFSGTFFRKGKASFMMELNYFDILGWDGKTQLSICMFGEHFQWQLLCVSITDKKSSGALLLKRHVVWELSE